MAKSFILMEARMPGSGNPWQACRSLNVEILGRDPVKIAFLQNLIRRLLFSLKEEEKDDCHYRNNWT
jgi:hypothetical protein